jgi:hypothetical protein
MTTTTSRRAVSAVAIDADPACAAIKRYKVFDVESAANAEQEPSGRSPKYPAWKAKRDSDMKKWNALRNAMLQTVPTTRAGALALIAAVTSGDYVAKGDIDAEDALILLGTLAKAVPAHA